MKRNLTIVLLSFVLIVIFQVSSFRLQSHIIRPLTGGLSSDPGESTCVSCHQYGPFVDSARFIFRIAQDSMGLSNNTSIITSGSQYTPGYTQWVSIEMVGANGSTPDYGFQLTALQANDSMAGSFTLANTNNTSIEISTGTPTGTRSYVGHANANSNKIWSFRWTAPDSGNVTFYYNGNFGNGDQQTFGDSIYRGTFTLTKGMASGIATVTGNIHYTHFYPIPISDELTADLYFNAASAVTITMLSQDGKIVKELYHGQAPAGKFIKSFSMTDIAAGIYLVQVQSGTDSKVIKVAKL